MRQILRVFPCFVANLAGCRNKIHEKIIILTLRNVKPITFANRNDETIVSR